MDTKHATPYQVGYKRPPKAYRWRPGQSGNPKGRPRGSKNKPTLESILHHFGQVEVRKVKRQQRRG